MSLRRALLAGLLLAAASYPLATPAQAGSYRVYVCQAPDGTRAPLSGWTTSNSLAYAGPYDRCNSGEGFGVHMTSTPLEPLYAWSGVQSGVWQLTLPAGSRLTLDRVQLRRALQIATPQAELADSATAHPFGSIVAGSTIVEHCREALGCASLGDLSAGNDAVNDRTYELAGSTGFRLEAGCGGADPNAYCRPAPVDAPRVDLRVWGATLHVRDDLPPYPLQQPAGSVLRAGPRSGIETLAFAMADDGAGVHRVFSTLDGAWLGESIPSTYGGRCVDADAVAGDHHEFEFLQPCPAAVPVALGIDTTRVPDGERLLEVHVVDAAGNATTVLSQPIEVRNAEPEPTPEPPAPPPPPPPPLPPAPEITATLQLDKRSARGLRADHGERQTLTGAVQKLGTTKPLAGATVEVRERLRHVGAQWRTLAPVTTGADGRFRVPVATNASRVVRFTSGGSSAETQIDVKAKLSLRAAARRVAAGGTVRLAGRVTLAALPRRGAVVALQSRWDGRWRTIDTVRTSRKGAFSWRYTLRRSRRGTLPFRAVLLTTADVAASGGTSRVVKVGVGR